MSFSIRRWVSAGAIAASVLGGVTLAAPAVQAAAAVQTGPSVLWYQSPYVWTDANALAECQAMGQQEVASGNWDTYACRNNPPGLSFAIHLWWGVWVGCPTCARPHTKP